MLTTNMAETRAARLPSRIRPRSGPARDRGLASCVCSLLARFLGVPRLPLKEVIVPSRGAAPVDSRAVVRESGHAAVHAVAAPVAPEANAFCGSGRYATGPQEAVIHMQPCKLSQHCPEMAIHVSPPSSWLHHHPSRIKGRSIPVSLNSM
jgi:hypothetical protein